MRGVSNLTLGRRERGGDRRKTREKGGGGKGEMKNKNKGEKNRRQRSGGGRERRWEERREYWHCTQSIHVALSNHYIQCTCTICTCVRTLSPPASLGMPLKQQMPSLLLQHVTKVGELSHVEVPQSHQLSAVYTIGLIFCPCPSITGEGSGY